MDSFTLYLPGFPISKCVLIPRGVVPVMVVKRFYFTEELTSTIDVLSYSSEEVPRGDVDRGLRVVVPGFLVWGCYGDFRYPTIPLMVTRVGEGRKRKR